MTDAELARLAVAQAHLGFTRERRWLRAAPKLVGHCSRACSRNRSTTGRARLGTLMHQAVYYLARECPFGANVVRLVGGTKIICAMSRVTVKRSNLAGYCGYGYDKSHSAFFWGCKLVLDVTADSLVTAAIKRLIAARAWLTYEIIDWTELIYPAMISGRMNAGHFDLCLSGCGGMARLFVVEDEGMVDAIFSPTRTFAGTHSALPCPPHTVLHIPLEHAIREPPGHPHAERIVQEQIRDRGRDRRPLGSPDPRPATNRQAARVELPAATGHTTQLTAARCSP